MAFVSSHLSEPNLLAEKLDFMPDKTHNLYTELLEYKIKTQQTANMLNVGQGMLNQELEEHVQVLENESTAFINTTNETRIHILSIFHSEGILGNGESLSNFVNPNNEEIEKMDITNEFPEGAHFVDQDDIFDTDVNVIYFSDSDYDIGSDLDQLPKSLDTSYRCPING